VVEVPARRRGVVVPVSPSMRLVVSAREAAFGGRPALPRFVVPVPLLRGFFCALPEISSSTSRSLEPDAGLYRGEVCVPLLSAGGKEVWRRG